jgi:hypothetical protein
MWAKTVKQRIAERTNKKGPYPSKEAIRQWPEIAGIRCWIATNTKEYGTVWFKDKAWQVHRLMYVLKFGKIPKKTPCVLHKCDVHACRRPSHLFLGTHKINSDDKCAKGRQAKGKKHSLVMPYRKGEAHPQAILTDKNALKIRRMYAAGKGTQKELGMIFGVHGDTISNVITRKTFAHI